MQTPLDGGGRGTRLGDARRRRARCGLRSVDIRETKCSRGFDRRAWRADDRLPAQTANDAGMIRGRCDAEDIQAVGRPAILGWTACAATVIVMSMTMPGVIRPRVAVATQHFARRMLVQLIVHERTESMRGKVGRKYKQGGSARARGAKHENGPTQYGSTLLLYPRSIPVVNSGWERCAYQLPAQRTSAYAPRSGYCTSIALTSCAPGTS